MPLCACKLHHLLEFFLFIFNLMLQLCSVGAILYNAVEHSSLKNKPSASVQVHKINLHAPFANVSSSCIHFLQTGMQKINSSAQFYGEHSLHVTLKSVVTTVLCRRATDHSLSLFYPFDQILREESNVFIVHAKWQQFDGGEMNNALRLVRYSNYFFPLPVCFIFIMSSSFP